MIIGITGTIGAGKGTVVAAFLEHGFVHYSASALLRELLAARGVAPNRDSYSMIAREIRAGDPAGIVKLLHARAEKDGAEHYIIEALHDVGEAEYIKSIGGVIIGIDAAVKTRYERVRLRGSEKDNVTFEEFLQQVAREEEGGEGHNIKAVLTLADYVLLNNGTKEDLESSVAALSAKLGLTK